MFVLKRKSDGQFLSGRSWVQLEDSYGWTSNIQRARVFGRASDYKQSKFWVGHFEPASPWQFKMVRYTDQDRPVEAVRVALAVINNPNIKDVSIEVL